MKVSTCVISAAVLSISTSAAIAEQYTTTLDIPYSDVGSRFVVHHETGQVADTLRRDFLNIFAFGEGGGGEGGGGEGGGGEGGGGEGGGGEGGGGEGGGEGGGGEGGG